MDESQPVKRTTNACQRCRSRKVKCSGNYPCDKCRQRRQECIFEEDRKIVVSEELFLSLKRKVEELEGISPPRSTKQARIDDARPPEVQRVVTPEPREGSKGDERFASNPLVSPSTYLKNDGRRRTWLFLGPTSTWSFSRRVLNIIQSRLNPSSTKSIPIAQDGDAYQLHWRQASSEEIPDTSGLPSLEHALYMLNTVQFHFGHLYRLFDEEEFLLHLHEFYDDAASKVQSNRLWYVQFLMILAFGEAFLAPVRRASNTASWTKYFSRAMSLLPDVTGLWQEPILSIEVLALIGLYFHSVDMRDTAYVYIGHAMRMALVEGLHRALPVEQLGQKLVDRSNNIWWTVYILDRKFASLNGSPSSVTDDEITSVLWDPRTSSKKEAALSLNVRISQVITRVLTTVYSADGRLGGLFVRKLRSVLHEMTDLSRELEDVFAHRFSNSVDAPSGVTTRLTLTCHLCIIVTTRPLVLSLLWERISCFEGGDTFRTLSSAVRSILQASVDSSFKSLRILTALRDQNLLETFLPFDLENLFSSFFNLCLVAGTIPDVALDPSYREMGFTLLDDMIARGNCVAQLRKSEIELLEELVQPLVQSQRSTTPTDLPRYQPIRSLPDDHLPVPERSPVPPLAVDLNAPAGSQEEDLQFDWRGLGLSLDHMLSVTDQLNTNSLVLDAEREELQTDLWLWCDEERV